MEEFDCEQHTSSQTLKHILYLVEFIYIIIIPYIKEKSTYLQNFKLFGGGFIMIAL